MDNSNIKKKISIFVIPLFVVALNILIFLNPAQSLNAAKVGLSLWAASVLPGMFPFVVGANLLMALGVAGFLGELLSPITKFIFKVPGGGGFALAMGLISGYPIGAKITSQMRLDGELSKTQAQRLSSFTSNAGPLFIIGAVGVGMFGSSHLGYFMALCHYIGTLIIGLAMRFYNTKNDNARNDNTKNDNSNDDRITKDPQPIYISAIKALQATRHKDSRGFGAIFGQCVLSAIETMLLVGGFIVLFSVITSILTETGAFNVMAVAFGPLLEFVRIPKMFHVEHFAGLVEMTNGIYLLSQHGISRHAVALTSGLISFGGLSILFQSINFLGKTDISMAVFVICKIAHGFISGFLAFVIYPFFASMMESPGAAAVYGYGLEFGTGLCLGIEIGVVSRSLQSFWYFIVTLIILVAISFFAFIFALLSSKKRYK